MKGGDNFHQPTSQNEKSEGVPVNWGDILLLQPVLIGLVWGIARALSKPHSGDNLAAAIFGAFFSNIGITIIGSLYVHAGGRPTQASTSDENEVAFWLLTAYWILGPAVLALVGYCVSLAFKPKSKK